MINFRISSNQVREYWDGALNSAKSYISSDLSEDAAKACEELADAVLREKKGRLRKGKRGGWKLLVFPLVLLATLDLGADEFFDHVL